MIRLVKPFIPVPFRRALRAAQSRLVHEWRRRLSPNWCPVCEQAPESFKPIDPALAEQCRRHGFELDLRQWETLNVDRYNCPRCDATDRDRLYALYLSRRLTGVRAPFRFIDFAPSYSLSKWIRKSFRLDYRTADLLMEGVDDRVDLTDLRVYPDGSVDAFLCSHVLEHVRDDLKAMRELFRILRPGGWGILMVPICLSVPQIREDPAQAATEAERWRYFGQGDHLRIYNKKGFTDRLAAAGFRVKSFGVQDFGAITFRRCGIAPSSVLYVGEKSASAKQVS